MFSISDLRLYFLPHTGTLGCEACHPVHQLLPRWPAAALPAPLHNPPPRWVHQPRPCHKSSPPSCLSPPLLPVWVSVSSLSPWLSDFHTVRFSVSSGCFLFLNCCCPFGCARRHSVSTYASILAGSPCVCSFKMHLSRSQFISSGTCSSRVVS